MRVLVLTQLYPTVAAPHRAAFMPELLAALSRHVDVRAVVPQAVFPGQRLLRGAASPLVGIDAPPAPLYHISYTAVPGLLRNARPVQMLRQVAPVVRRLHQESPVDVVFGHFLFPDGVAAARLAAELDLPLALMAHGSDVNHHASIPSQRRQIATALGRADACVVVSEPLRRRLLELGLPADDAEVISVGYDPDAFAPRFREPARRSLGLGSAPLLVYVGALRRLKRVDVLLDALALPPLDGVHLALVGDGPERARLEARARGLALGPRLRWAGAQPHQRIPDWLAAADALVLPSESEGTPTVLIEALAMARPVVATDVGGIPDLVGDVARLAAPGDAAALATAVRATLDAPPSAEQLRARVAERSWPRVGERLAEVLARAAQR